MQSLSTIRALLESRGLAPRKRLGQNFLHDANQVRRLVVASGVGSGDRVLEVGPGTGALTEALLEAGAEIVAVELDPGLADLLAERLGDRVTLVRGDALDRGRHLAPAVIDALGPAPFRLVANLPYQAASPLMAALLVDGLRCLGQYVTIQREVADRLVAGPGTKAYGPLGIIVGALAEVRRIAIVPPSCFWPEPKVTSAMVAIEPRGDALVDDAAGFARFVTTLFAARRKQLGTTLGRDIAWPEGIESTMRPEAVPVEGLAALFEATQ